MNILIVIAIVVIVGGAIWAFKTKLIELPFGSSSATLSTLPGIPLQTWNILFSPGMPPQMRDDGNGPGGGWSFDFPPQNGIHYVETPAPANMAVGRTMTMSYSIVGDGKIMPTEFPEHPARIRLFMQRKRDDSSGVGQYQQYRYWSSDAPVLTAGDFQLSVQIVENKWNDVAGKSGSSFPGGFLFCVTDASAIGFTFGGDMAGHGCYVTGGSAKFILKSFSIS